MEQDQHLIAQEERPDVYIPSRSDRDRLPVRPSWQVFAFGMFYGLLGLIFAGLVTNMLLGGDSLSWLAWCFTIFIILGVLAAWYSAIDELRHAKNALRLDKEGVECNARIVDIWQDNYADGGVYTRKKVSHVIYLYNNDQNYGKHAVSKNLSGGLSNDGWVPLVYLPDKPEVFRLKM